MGRHLAGLLGRPFIDLDGRIEHDCGATIRWIFELEGEAGFRARERAALLAVAEAAPAVIATGAGVVLDPANRQTLRAAGVVILLAVDVAEQLRRLARDTTRPLLRGADRAERLAEMAATREPLYRALAQITLVTRASGPLASARALLRELHTFEASTGPPGVNQ